MKGDMLTPQENGELAVEELRGILDVLPIDVTFVGPDDKILYYNRNRDKIYGRTADLIGCRVQDCHGMSQRAGRAVTQILRSLSTGESDGQSRIVTTMERRLHIQYLPVRDEEGAFLGTLQITQDITRLADRQPRNQTGDV